MTTTNKTSNVTFAGLVDSAARTCRSAMPVVPGDDERKVWISDVAAALRMDLASTKTALLAASQAGLVSLCRADMAHAMDAGKVQASETRHPLSGTYHFVCV